MMKHKIWPLTLAFIGLVTLSTAAFAKEKELTESYIVDLETEIHLEATVGTVELMPSDNDAVAYFGLSGQRFRHHSDKRSGVVRTS